MQKTFDSLYAEIERDGDFYAVYNRVTGLLVRLCPNYAAALGEATLLHQHYAGVERNFR